MQSHQKTRSSRDAGESRKLAAHVLLEAHRDRVILDARRALLFQLLDVGIATADDVRAAVELPDSVDPVCLGAVPGPLAKAGIIEPDGFAKTVRPKAHARPVTVWRLCGPSAAFQWLESHPPLAVLMTAGQLPLPFHQNETPTADTAGVSFYSTPTT